MKTKIAAWSAILALGMSVQSASCQNTLQFTSVNATPERAIQLHWASNTNEVYEVDEANALATNADGSTAWNDLYDDYPSQGTNTFITDDGNYDISPEIPHPKYSPMRFYRVMLVEDNSSPTNPTVSIISPADGDMISGTATIQVAASSPEILSEVNLYIDGEEQWSSGDDSNFVINTCEWLNGNHTIFATAKSQSGYEGVADGGTITYGRAVSPIVNVTFSNLISGFDFSQPFFEPALGQTQEVTATFAANCDWTLQVEDVNSNVVRTATGSGDSMEFDWNGTGDGDTNISDGVYTYLLSAETNGEADEIVTNGSGGGGSPPSPDMDASELWAMSADGNDAAPLALYPPGMDTNGLTVFSATPTQVNTARTSASRASIRSTDSGSGFSPMDSGGGYSGSASQSTAGPTRKPKVGNKGVTGTFGILYKTYGTNGFTSQHPTTGWPYPLPTLVAIDGQSATALTTDYRISQFKYMANGFVAGMKKAAWKPAFVKVDNQWSAADIKKTSLGGHQIFDTCNLGILMTHGSYATTAEDDNVKYTYVWLGGNNYVRLSDMEFGDSENLKWMTIIACNVLRAANVTSMANNSKLPIGDNLHLLLGCSSTAYAAVNMGKYYASNLVANVTVPNAWYNCGSQAYNDNSRGITNTVTFRTMGQQNCFSDTLSANNAPDENTAFQIQDQNVFTYP